MFNAHVINAATIMAYAQSRPKVLGKYEKFQCKDLCRVYPHKVRKFEAMFQRLVHMGWLNGLRGPKGGYELTNAGAAVTGLDLVRAFPSANDAPFLALFEDVLSGLTPESIIERHLGSQRAAQQLDRKVSA